MKYFGILFFFFISLYLIYNFQNSLFKRYTRRKYLMPRPGFVVDTIGCQIPELDPFDSEVRKFYRRTESKSCPNVNVLASSNRTHLTIDSISAKEMFGNRTNCGYKKVWRSGNGLTDNQYSMDASYRTVTGTTRVVDEFLNVGCFTDKRSVYLDLFPFIQMKPDVEKKCESNLKRWIDETENTVSERLGVIMLGVDSISRLNMLRHMTKTFNYIKNLMSTIELRGFTKVADNAFNNMMPTLSGLFAEECWSESKANESIDYMNLIWKEFSARGYRTLFAEDFPQFSIFNYSRGGFHQQPTHYYLRPFTLAASQLLHIGNGCYNNRTETDVVLQWLTDFLQVFKGKPTFSLTFNTRLTHADLNNAGIADDLYYNFLSKMNVGNFMDNNILIFFSDHGIRFGEIRDTYVGKIEERMPFYFLIFPPWFRLKYLKIWNNLKINENRLTTPFDIYATLKDILHFTGKVRKADLNDRGISLFNEIPEERTCLNAAILPHWCTCDDTKRAEVDEEIVVNGAQLLVEFINSKIKQTNCAVLQLDKIVDARMSSVREQMVKFRTNFKVVVNGTSLSEDRFNIANYLITFNVKPSNGLFEGSAQYTETTKSYVVGKEIRRINFYGNQSDCTGNPLLRKFCYCTFDNQ